MENELKRESGMSEEMKNSMCFSRKNLSMEMSCRSPTTIR